MAVPEAHTRTCVRTQEQRGGSVRNHTDTASGTLFVQFRDF